MLLARSVRNLCARHRSDLAVSLDQEAAAADTMLWVNDKLADVSRKELSKRVGMMGKAVV